MKPVSSNSSPVVPLSQYEGLKPFDIFMTWCACMAHFSNTGYDYFKYCGKIGVTEAKFQVRKDRVQFYRGMRIMKNRGVEERAIPYVIAYQFMYKPFVRMDMLEI